MGSPDVEVFPLRLRHNKTARLMKRFGRLPKWMRELVREDMETSFENRITVMEEVVRRGL